MYIILLLAIAPVALWAISASNSVIAYEATSSITGSFTVINPARPVTAELRYNSSNGAIASTMTIPIAPANVLTPVVFEFNGINPGTYSLIFWQPGHTSFTINNIVVAGGINVNIAHNPNFPLQLPLHPGNVTGSGQVNVIDLSMLLQHWLSTDIYANFTGSGQVNVADLSLLLQNWMAESIVVHAAYVQEPTPTPDARAPFILSPPWLLGGRAGNVYHYGFFAIGEEPITWAIQSGSLPPGLSLYANTGEIIGTPTAAGTFELVARAQNRYGYSIRTFSIFIDRQLSSITLPNRRLTDIERDEWITDYIAFGGPTAVELEIVRLVNIERAYRGLTQVELDMPLMMAARFYAQQHYDLRHYHAGWGHNFGPYATNPAATHGASANVASAFGGNLRWNGGNGYSRSFPSAESIVRVWMNSPGHRNYILAPDHRFIGAGQFPNGITYLFLTTLASNGTQEIQITFNANGGTGTMQSQTFLNGVAQHLRPNTFTKEGYTFMGWRIVPYEGIVHFPDNSVIIINEERILGSITTAARSTIYAVWSRNPREVTVVFDSNGGIGTMPIQTFLQYEPQYLLSNTFTKEGYTFLGWNVHSNSVVPWFTNGQSLTFLDSDNFIDRIILYAVWSRN